MRRSQARTERRPERSGEEREGRRKPAAGAVEIPMPDVVNEIVVIAAALVDAEVRGKLVPTIPTDNFFGEGHPEIWGVVKEMHRQGLHYDPATVRQLSGGAVDPDYLDAIVAQRPAVPPNLAHHVEMMRWDRARVEAIRGPVGNLVKALRDPTTDRDRVRQMARQVSQAFEGHGATRYLRDPEVLVREQMAAIQKRRGGVACYPYGVDGFDRYADGEKAGQWRMIPGLAPGQVTVVTGVPGSGKTTFTAGIGLACVDQRRRVLYGAWEQGSGNTLELMAAQRLGLSRTRLTTGDITDQEETDLQAEMEYLSSWVRFFEIPFGREPGVKQLNDRNLDLIHEYIVTSGCEVFVADLWRRAIRQFDPDEEEAALYRQQAIAQETGVHCVLLHQQRAKDLEAREDKRPTREGLKGSGGWFEVPDTIIGIHREFLFKSVPDDVLELLVLKQRHGVWPLAVHCDWDADIGRVWNGRTAEVARPGQATGVDSFLDAPPEKRWRGGSGGRRK